MPSGYREQRQMGPVWACGRINFHLHRGHLKEVAAFVLGSDGGLPACVCELRRGEVWLQHPLCLNFFYLVNALPFLWDASIS